MLIFANNCFAGFLYKELHIKYNQPFCWGWFDFFNFDNYFNFMNNFIKYKNENLYEFNIIPQTHIKNDIKRSGTELCYPSIYLKDFSFNYSHYVYDSNYDVPTKIGINVHAKHIFDFTREKYIERAKRIPNEEPIYILHINHITPEDNNNLLKFINSNFKIIYVCRHKENYDFIKSKTNQNVPVFIHEDGKDIADICKELLPELKKCILNFNQFI